MSKFTQKEVDNLLKGLPTQQITKGLKHSACRLLDLLEKEVPKYKFNEISSDILTKLREICKKSGGLNVKGMGQRGVVGRYIDQLRSQGLEEYLIASEPIVNNKLGVANNQGANNQGANNKSGVTNNKSLKNIFLNAVQGIQDSDTKLKAIQEYIDYWNKTTVNTRQKNGVTEENVRKIQLLKPLVDDALVGKNITLPVGYNHDKWFPLVEKMWPILPGANTSPPKDPFDEEQSPLSIGQTYNFNNNNKIKESKGNNGEPKGNNNQQPKENINQNNIGRKIEEIERKLKGVIENLEKIAPSNGFAKGGKRRKTRRGGKKLKCKMTRRNK